MRRVLAVLALLSISGMAAAQTAPVLRSSRSASTPLARIDWSTVPGVTWYQVRRTYTFPTGWVTYPPTTSNLHAEWLNDTTPNQAVFQVTPCDASGNPVGPASNYAWVTKYSYASVITVGQTLVVPSHITELRSIVTSVRASMGLGAPTWTQATLTPQQTLIQGADIQDLRNAINDMTNLMNLPAPPYAQAAPLQGKLIRKVDVQQLRDILRSYPEMYWPFPAALDPYFSPNGDGVKDTTTFRSDVSWNQGSSRTDFRWQIIIRNSANAIVRTDSGSSVVTPPTASDNPRVIHQWVWDGRDGSGVIQPDGVYSYEIIDLDTIGGPMPSNWGRTTVTIDTVAPTATITAPADPYTLSNVRLNGGGSVTVTGTVSDALSFDTWKLERIGNGEPTVQLGTGTTAVSNGTLGTLSTISNNSPTIPNGAYQLKLTATDKAGNSRVETNDVTVAHFRAVLTGHQINTVATPAQTVMYTSYVPFALNETIQVRSQTTNAVVRTLFNGSRAAGTYDDSWNGKNDSNEYLGDGSYFIITTVTEGSNTFVWDETNVTIGGGFTQYEYPTCRNASGNQVSCTDSSIVFDPFLNKPLRINFCAGGGHVATGCSGSGPVQIIAKISTVNEETSTCDWKCFASYYAPSGAQEIVWYGTNLDGSYIAPIGTRLLILRGQTYPKNLIVLYGTKPTISIASMAPLMFNPAASAPQTFTVNVASPASRPISVSAKFRNVASYSILRTITLPAGTAAQQTITWDGKADNGAWCAPGTYEVILTATDSVGGTATIKPLVTVRY